MVWSENCMVWSEIVWFQIMNLMVWAGSGVGQSAYSEICVKIGSSNGLLPDGTKPIPEPIGLQNKCRTADPDGQKWDRSGRLSFFTIHKFWQNCAVVQQVSNLILKTASCDLLSIKTSVIHLRVISQPKFSIPERADQAPAGQGARQKVRPIKCHQRTGINLTRALSTGDKAESAPAICSFKVPRVCQTGSSYMYPAGSIPVDRDLYQVHKIIIQLCK